MRESRQFSRREFIRAIVGTSGALWVGENCAERVYGAVPPIILAEVGDPGAEPEVLSLTASQSAAVEAPLLVRSKGPKKDPRMLAAKMLELSKGYASASVSRASAPDQVKEFCELFGLGLRENNVYVPYCAAGVSFAACRAYCALTPGSIFVPTNNPYSDPRVKALRATLTDINHYYFKPSPSVTYIRDDAVRRGTWVPSDVTPEEGWLVVFSWTKDKTPNHIGLVDRVLSSTNELQTVEFNTTPSQKGSNVNGGAVAQKTRAMGNVLGFVRTY